MSMITTRACVLAGLGAILGGGAAADAAITGKFSGTLSTNPNIKRQQLIADPEVEGQSTVPLLGRFSVSYDPTLNAFDGYAPGPGYLLTSTLIEVKQPGVDAKHLVDFNTFLEYRGWLQYEETGFIQIGFQLIDGAYFREMGGTIPIPEEYEFIAIDGDPRGADMAELYFNSPDAPVPMLMAMSSVSALDNRNLGIFKVFSQGDDFMWFDANDNYLLDDGDIYMSADQMEAAVVPEPTVLGLAGLAAVGTLMRRRRAGETK